MLCTDEDEKSPFLTSERNVYNINLATSPKNSFVLLMYCLLNCFECILKMKPN